MRINRSARLYFLGDVQSAQELWVVCHGYGQLAGRFIRHFGGIATAERLIIAPEGLHRFYLDPPPVPAQQRRVGSTWMTREDRETDISDYVAYLDRVVQETQARTSVRLRIKALGFSQGAATVFRWAALGATDIETLVLWAGEIPRDVDIATAQARLAAVRVILVRGRTDALTPEQVVQAQLTWLERYGVAAETREFAGGHALDKALLGQIAARS